MIGYFVRFIAQWCRLIPGRTSASARAATAHASPTQLQAKGRRFFGRSTGFTISTGIGTARFGAAGWNYSPNAIPSSVTTGEVAAYLDREGVEFSLEKYVEDLEAVAEAARLTRFALFGMSNGAHAAAAYAARNPGRVTRLVLCSCQSLGRLAGNPKPEQIEEVNARVKMIELAWPGEHPAYAQFSASLHIPKSTNEQKLAHNELLCGTTSAENAVALIKAIARSDLRELLPQIRCPTLVLHPRGNSIIRFEEGRKVAALIPSAQFVPLESRNHVLLDSEPAWKQFVAAYDSFLPLSPGAQSISILKDLTPREREILEVIAQGLDNNDIAARFSISEKTVRNHVSIIFSKLGVNSRAHAVAVARDAGYGRPMVP